MYHAHAHPSAIRQLNGAQSSAGIVLMAAALAALLIANPPFGPDYEAILHGSVWPLSLGHWITDGLGGVIIIGVFGCSDLVIRLGLSDMPAHASRRQLLGVTLLRGIGFTMIIFIKLFAFRGNSLLQAKAKLGILAQSFLSGPLGFVVLRHAKIEPGSLTTRVAP